MQISLSCWNLYLEETKFPGETKKKKLSCFMFKGINLALGKWKYKNFFFFFFIVSRIFRILVIMAVHNFLSFASFNKFWYFSFHIKLVPPSIFSSSLDKYGVVFRSPLCHLQSAMCVSFSQLLFLIMNKIQVLLSSLSFLYVIYFTVCIQGCMFSYEQPCFPLQSPA